MPIDFSPQPAIECQYQVNAEEYSKRFLWFHHHKHKTHTRVIYPSIFQKVSPLNAEYHHIRHEILSVNKMRRKKTEASIHEIIPGLYIGSQKDADTHPWWITRVLTCRQQPRPPVINHCAWKGIDLPDNKSAKIQKSFKESFEFIENTHGAILVHCKAGGSRSPTLVIAYLMKKYNVPFLAAYRYVRSKNPRSGPNPGFIRQLKKYEKKLQKMKR